MRIKLIKILTVIAIAFAFTQVEAKTVRYELVVRNEKVNLSGKKEVDFALTVNGSIPAPTLEFTEGDDAEILVKNELHHEEVSIHWHGILLPPEEDGVAYVNTPPIFAGQSRLFKFKIRQHGTYWYHSHTKLQEQKGVYGAFIIHPKQRKINYDKDLVVVLSDWSDENSDKIINNLKKDGDYYLYKKDSVRSYLGAIKSNSLKTHLANEWDRMGGMDLSDVGYDAFLINGKKDSQLLNAKPGEKIRVRIINAGASSYFYISLGNLPMKVVSADGVDINPIMAKEILMGMAETYDVLFTVPAQKNYELRATVQDVTGFASGWIGGGPRVFGADQPMPNMYASMDHGSHEDHSQHQASEEDHSGHGDHSDHEEEEEEVVESLTVDDLKAQAPTKFPPNKKVHELKLVLDGDMERYVWHINGKAIHEDRNILIQEGEVVRFNFVNNTMMHHPMHLHGHFFRVINDNGDYSPLKHTVDVPPHGQRTIEFYADEPGKWMLHCHNLYHMKTGMARVVNYMTFKPSPEMAEWDKKDPHLHDHMYWMASADAFTNFGEAKLRFSKTWDVLEFRGETKKAHDEWEKEGDIFYRRWFDNYSNLIVGAAYAHEETRAVIGIGYLLPMLIESNILLDLRGKARLDLGKKFQWSKYIFSDLELKFRDGHDVDWVTSLMYANRWNWSAGFKFTEGNVGLGFQYRF